MDTTTFTEQDRATARLSGSNAADRDFNENPKEMGDDVSTYTEMAVRYMDFISVTKQNGETPDWRSYNALYWSEAYVARAAELLSAAVRDQVSL